MIENNSMTSQRAFIFQNNERKKIITQTLIENRIIFSLNEIATDYKIDDEIIKTNKLLNLIIKNDFSNLLETCQNEQVFSEFFLIINKDQKTINRLTTTEFFDYCLSFVYQCSKVDSNKFTDKTNKNWLICCLSFLSNVLINYFELFNIDNWVLLIHDCTNLFFRIHDYQLNYIVLNVISNYAKTLNEFKLKEKLTDFTDNEFLQIHTYFVENIHNFNAQKESFYYFYKTMFYNLRLLVQ